MMDSTSTVDSLYIAGVTDSMRSLLIRKISVMVSQSGFPKVKMKVGQTISHKGKISFDIPNIHDGLMTRLRYTLISVHDGIAKLDVDATLIMKPIKYKMITMTVRGSGKGTLEYDVANHFYTYYQQSLTINAVMALKLIVVHMHIEGGIIQRGVATPLH